VAVTRRGGGGGTAVDYLVRKTNRHRRRNETDGNKRAAGSAIVVRARARACVCVKRVDDGRTTDENDVGSRETEPERDGTAGTAAEVRVIARG